MTVEELAAAGCRVDQATYGRLAEFVRLLGEETRKLNLTAIRDEAGMWALHVCDSLALVPLIDAAGARSFIDVGSGGGVPGIPVACVRPDLRVTLLDATRKKVDALRRIIAGLGLSHVSAEWGRAEQLATRPEWRDRFDGLAARAVASLETLVDFAEMVRPGGWCWFFKSPTVQAELAAAAGRLGRNGLEFVRMHRYKLPASHGERLIVEYRKTSSRSRP